MANGADDIGGDGSDSDLYEIAGEAADTAVADLYDSCTNAGMEALADMIADAIYAMADDMATGSRPDIGALFDAIAGVHSSDTAQSCMTEGITTAYEDLMDGYDEIVAHEGEEGVGFL